MVFRNIAFYIQLLTMELLSAIFEAWAAKGDPYLAAAVREFRETEAPAAPRDTDGDAGLASVAACLNVHAALF